MNKLTLTSILTLLLICGTMLYGQQHDANKYDLEKDNYYVWSGFSDFEKSAYTRGYLAGAVATAWLIAFESGHADLLRFVEDRIPEYSVGEFRVGMDWIYEDPQTHEIPMYRILLNFEALLERRRDIYRKTGK